jgi:hypothetical protein
VRVSRLVELDRSSRLVLTGVGILALAGIGASLLTSMSVPAADTTTPLGVVRTYIRAVQAGDADRAYALTGAATIEPSPGQPPRPLLSREDFRAQVQAGRLGTGPRIRILSSTQSASTATVDLEVTHASGDPLTGASSRSVTIFLTLEPDGWRITSDPLPGEVQ